MREQPPNLGLAGSFTVNGTTTTWVPLIEASGSTIALVNAANVVAGPVTTYTYDPAGNPTVSGTANDWPFQYQGMEKEFTDPGPYYYTGGGQFYSAQLVRSPSETGQTSSQGPGGAPSGNGIAAPSGSGGPDVGRNAAIGTGAGVGVGGGLVALAFIWGVDATTGGILTGAAIVASIIDGLVQGFLDLFGGGSSEPPTPRQLLHGRHPLYPVILGIPNGLIPTEKSEGLKVCGDPHPSSARPLPKDPAPDCSEYGRACAQCGPLDTYDCEMAPAVCNNTPSGPNNPRSNCIRGCLQSRRALELGTCLGCVSGYLGGVIIPDLEVNHAICFAKCVVSP